MAWTITRAPVPADLEDPAAWALHGASAVSYAADRASYGYDDVAYSARYMLARLHEQQYATRVRLVATPAGVPDPGASDVVGTASLIMPLQGNTHLAHLELTVHPEQRRRGAGAALLDEAECLAAAHGRTTVIAASDHAGEPPADSPGVLVAPTGSGRIRADDPAAVLASRRGYVLEQAERYSVLELPVDTDRLDGLHAAAAAVAGPDYRLLSWTHDAPQEYVEQVARLETRMSTDAPVAGLDMGQDPWDADRVRTWEAGIAEAGHGLLTVAAEHVPSGVLAAFTVVEYPWDQPHVVFQEDTLVLAEHRGRRLGMLVKTELLRRLAHERPAARRVHTWNAEENQHMLAINVALGFRVAGVSGQWQRRLPPS